MPVRPYLRPPAVGEEGLTTVIATTPAAMC